MSEGIQLIGIDSVLSVYEDYDQEGYCWSLYQGKEPVVSGDDSEDLEKWLKRFEPHGSTAAYTLKIYRAASADHVNKATPPVAAFRFKLIDNYAGQGIGGYNNQLWQRVAALEKKQSGEDSDEEKTLTGQLLGLFDDPEKIKATVGAITQIIGAIRGKVLGGIHQIPAQQPGGEDTLENLAQSLDTLEKHDPQLSQHLKKLAQLAENDPLIFKGVLSKLDAL